MQSYSLYDVYSNDTASSDSERARPKEARRSRKISYARGGGRPAVHNGVHRRRNKRWTW